MTLFTLAARNDAGRIVSFCDRRELLAQLRPAPDRKVSRCTAHIPVWLRWCTVDVLSRSDSRGLSTLLIKSQMNDISGAIISYCYYRDGYYVSHAARAFSLVRSSVSLALSVYLSPSRFLPSLTALSFHLPPSSPPPPVSGNALTVACKESGHCAARKQKPRLRERARISIIEYIPISSGKRR